jgi:tRNA(Arg) A34 adenosine deaminase TadA
MCCMALIHSRIRRLIFWRGVKTGARQVAWMKGDEIEGVLNHRFMCFEGIPGALGDDMEVVELGQEIFA